MLARSDETALIGLQTIGYGDIMNPQEPVLPDPNAPQSPIDPVEEPPTTDDGIVYDVR
jgi:hypothetical protein